MKMITIRLEMNQAFATNSHFLGQTSLQPDHVTFDILNLHYFKSSRLYSLNIKSSTTLGGKNMLEWQRLNFISIQKNVENSQYRSKLKFFWTINTLYYVFSDLYWHPTAVGELPRTLVYL